MRNTIHSFNYSGAGKIYRKNNGYFGRERDVNAEKNQKILFQFNPVIENLFIEFKSQ